MMAFSDISTAMLCNRVSIEYFWIIDEYPQVATRNGLPRTRA